MAESPKGDVTLNDFRKQLSHLKKMGPTRKVMASLPGLGDMIREGEELEDSLTRIEGMIDAMMDEERRNPDIIDQSRRERIASDSGTQPHEVQQFLAQFNQLRAAMRHMAQMALGPLDQSIRSRRWPWARWTQ
jgi:signal recognition particle subunit SRP54